MKKEFNFKNIKGLLSRDEMKAIKGGKNQLTNEDAYKCCVGNECTDCVRSGGITCSEDAKRIKC